MKKEINHILTHLIVGETFTEEEVKLLNELRKEIENVLTEIKPLIQVKKLIERARVRKKLERESE